MMDKNCDLYRGVDKQTNGSTNMLCNKDGNITVAVDGGNNGQNSTNFPEYPSYGILCVGYIL